MRACVSRSSSLLRIIATAVGAHEVMRCCGLCNSELLRRFPFAVCSSVVRAPCFFSLTIRVRSTHTVCPNVGAPLE